MRHEPGEARLLEAGIVVGHEAVHPDDRNAVAQQPLGDVKADEPGGAGDENGRGHRVGGSQASWTAGNLASPPASASRASTTLYLPADPVPWRLTCQNGARSSEAVNRWLTLRSKA